MVGLATFTIVSNADVPLYEANLGQTPKREDAAHLQEFVAHAALDVVDERRWETPQTNLKLVDRFNDLLVYAHVTAGGTRFVLLHDARNEESVRAFFADVHELYVKAALNPFHDADAPIECAAFDDRVRALGRKYFP
jgi:hypothetical protein